MMYGYGNSMFLFNNGIIATPAANPLWDNLYAVYKAESNANDSLGIYNGTAIGGLTYGTGVEGNAFLYNGTNATVSMADNSFNSLISGDFSIKLNIDMKGVGADNQCIFSNAVYDGANWYGIYIYVVSNNIYCRIGDGTPTLISLSYSFTNYTFQNIVWTRKAGTRSRLYINGSLVASDTNTTNPSITTTHYPRLGALKYNASTTTYYLTSGSLLDEIYFWNREITADEVTELQTTYY